MTYKPIDLEWATQTSRLAQVGGPKWCVSTTRILYSHITGRHPRQTGSSYLGGSYPSAGDAVGIFYALADWAL